jgi:predicted kinase
MNTLSIYEIICESLTPDGMLPQNFSLPGEKTDPNKLRFVPGAKDGIGVFHYGSQHAEKAAKKIVKFLKSDWRKGSTNLQGKIAELLHKHGTLSVVDHVLNSIREDHKGVDFGSMVEYACQLAFQTADEELVKLGIGLLGLIDFSREQKIIDRLIILALYEELTLYVVVAISNCHMNDILFAIAQKVDGWGKIHTVERLDPASDEIRGWLLRKGCANSVMDAYLGLECAQKGNLVGALRCDSLDDDLFDSISVIINALLDEGPVAGISVYEHAEEALQRYLLFATDHAVTVKHIWYILNVQRWLEHAEITNRDDLRELCENIINRASWRELICEILNNPEDEQFFYASNAASRLNLDVSELIFKAIKQNPIKCSGYISIAYRNPEYAKQLTEIYEEVLPLEDMAAGMGDYLFAANLREEHYCLDFVLSELNKYPKMGEKLVQAALQSPVIRERNGACKVIEDWSKMLNQNLQAISPNLFSILHNIATIEVNSDTKKNMKMLLKM